jgi:hypothetical protein
MSAISRSSTPSPTESLLSLCLDGDIYWLEMNKEEIEENLQDPDEHEDLFRLDRYESDKIFAHFISLGLKDNLHRNPEALRAFLMSRYVGDCLQKIIEIDPEAVDACTLEGKSLFMQFMEGDFPERASLIAPAASDTFEGMIASFCNHATPFNKALFETFNEADKKALYRYANVLGRVDVVQELNKLQFVSPSLGHRKYAIFGPFMDIAALSIRTQAIFTAMRDAGDFLTQSEYDLRHPAKPKQPDTICRFKYDGNGFIDKYSLNRLFGALYFNTVCRSKGLTYPKANRFIAVVPDGTQTISFYFRMPHTLMFPCSDTVSVKAQ